jgi:molecular chaperone DnaK
VYSVEQALQEYGAHLEDGEREEVEESLGKARTALETSEAETLREAVEDLQQLAYRMTEAMYERMQAGEDSS